MKSAIKVIGRAEEVVREARGHQPCGAIVIGWQRAGRESCVVTNGLRREIRRNGRGEERQSDEGANAGEGRHRIGPVNVRNYIKPHQQLQQQTNHATPLYTTTYKLLLYNHLENKDAGAAMTTVEKLLCRCVNLCADSDTNGR